MGASFGYEPTRTNCRPTSFGHRGAVFVIPAFAPGRRFNKERLHSDAMMQWTQRRWRYAAMGSVATCALSFGAGGAEAADCASLAGKTFGAATIAAATNVSPPSSVVGADVRTSVAFNAPFCRIQGSIKPSPDSEIAFEVWLPPEAAWNGKYEGVGNGGFAGYVLYGAMDRALEGGLRGVGDKHGPLGRRSGGGLGPRPSRKDHGFRLARDP
jgi:feruloyl esterase